MEFTELADYAIPAGTLTEWIPSVGPHAATPASFLQMSQMGSLGGGGGGTGSSRAQEAHRQRGGLD